MNEKPHIGKLRWSWRKMFGEPPEVKVMLRLLTKTEDKLKQLEAEMEKVREERLRWQAREATTRKDLQDCQERGKELLEQVVRLTHKQRTTQQSLLDQKFKTQTTPLERNRFEMELTEARGRARRAEEKAKQAEAKLVRFKRTEKAAARVKDKDMESQLAWARKQSQAYLAALGASLEKLKNLELAQKQRHTKKHGAKLRRRYNKPAIHASKQKNSRSKPQPSPIIRKSRSKQRQPVKRP
jgi:chromosome segregation ATPase